MALALSDGKLANEQVGYINAHGTSTPANDRMETAAIRALLVTMLTVSPWFQPRA